MKDKLKALYNQEIAESRLNFDSDPEYQTYYTQAEALWKGEDMPKSFFHLLDTGNFISFAHGFRLGLALARWAQTGPDHRQKASF